MSYTDYKAAESYTDKQKAEIQHYINNALQMIKWGNHQGDYKMFEEGFQNIQCFVNSVQEHSDE